MASLKMLQTRIIFANKILELKWFDFDTPY